MAPNNLLNGFYKELLKLGAQEDAFAPPGPMSYRPKDTVIPAPEPHTSKVKRAAMFKTGEEEKKRDSVGPGVGAMLGGFGGGYLGEKYIGRYAAQKAQEGAREAYKGMSKEQKAALKKQTKAQAGLIGEAVGAKQKSVRGPAKNVVEHYRAKQEAKATGKKFTAGAPKPGRTGVRKRWSPKVMTEARTMVDPVMSRMKTMRGVGRWGGLGLGALIGGHLGRKALES